MQSAANGAMQSAAHGHVEASEASQPVPGVLHEVMTSRVRTTEREALLVRPSVAATWAHVTECTLHARARACPHIHMTCTST